MIRSLKIFCDVVDTKSFTKAASRNYITQSAVSHHLKTLEHKFRHKLLERSPKDLRVTPTGKTVYLAAQEIIERFTKLENDLDGDSREVSGTVRACSSLPVGLHILPAYINGCLARHPKIKIKLSYLRPSEICEGIIEDRMDIGFLTFPQETPRLETKIFTKDELVVICPIGDPLAAQRTIHIRKLQGRSFVGPILGHPVRRVIDRLFKKHKVKIRYVGEFTDLESAKEAVETGLGISMVPRFSISKEVRSGTLKVLLLEGITVECPVGLITKKRKELPPAARAFIDCVTSTPA